MAKNEVKKPVAAPAETKQEETSLTVQDKNTALAAAHIDFAEDAAEYQNEFSRDDFAIPFLQVLQTNSGQCTEGDPKYIEGAKAGYVLNTATGELFDTIKGQLILVPAHYRKTFIAWGLRELGGGFKADHGLLEGMKLLATCVKDEKKRMVIPNTNPAQQLVETMQYLVSYRSTKTKDVQGALLALTSTQLKKGRAWNALIDGIRIPNPSNPKKSINPPMFYQAYALKTVREENADGKWYGVVITSFAPTVEADEEGIQLYLTARQLRDGVKKGEIKMDNAAAAEAAANGENPDADPDNAEKAPF